MAAEDWDDVIDFVLSRTLCKLGLHFFEMDKIYRPEVKDCSWCKKRRIWCNSCQRYRNESVLERRDRERSSDG
jgi:hypothetical protein